MFDRRFVALLAGLPMAAPAFASDPTCLYGSYATLEEAQAASYTLLSVPRPSPLTPEICSDLNALGVPEACVPPPPPPTVTSLCRPPNDPAPENRKTLFFNAVIDEVLVTNLDSPPGATAPTAPSVGGTVSGSVTYWDAYNYLAEDLSTDPAFTGLSLSEIDAALPGGIFRTRSISLNSGGLQTELRFPGDRDATLGFLNESLAGVPWFAPASIGNNFPGAGDFFGVGGITPSMQSPQGFGFESAGDAYRDVVGWHTQVLNAITSSVVTACGEGLEEDAREALLAATPNVADRFSGYSSFAAFSILQAASIQVEDRDSAGLIPGTEREIGQTIYPTSSGATQNLFNWSFTQFGAPAPVAPLDLSPIQGLGSGSAGSETCNNALETIGAWYAGLEQPTFASSQGVSVTGRITSLSPTLALDPPPPATVIPLPAGLPLGLAGLGALVWLRRRPRRAA